MQNPTDDSAYKAVLEAMIFVSQEPVTLRQMLAKLNQVYKKWNPVLEDETAADASEIASSQSESAPASTLETATDTPAAASEPSVSAAPALSEDAEGEAPIADNLPISIAQIKTWVSEIQNDYSASNRGFELVAIAKGYQFRTKLAVAEALQTEKKALPGRLSASAMETLAVVAYEQPVTRARIDDVRGVDSSGVLKTLLEREFLRIVGRSDEPGQPLLYGTTNKFLEVFHLEHLKDLPSLGEIRDLYLQADDETSDEPARYFDPEEVIEQRVQAFSDEEMELMQELDESLTLVKTVEQGIEMLHPPKKEDGDGASPTPGSSTVH